MRKPDPAKDIEFIFFATRCAAGFSQLPPLARAVKCGRQATVRDFCQIGAHPPLTTPATVIPCKKCKRRPGYPIDARRRWRGWRRTAHILGGSSSGPALSRPPIRPRPAQPEARAVFVGDHILRFVMRSRMTGPASCCSKTSVKV